MQNFHVIFIWCMRSERGVCDICNSAKKEKYNPQGGRGSCGFHPDRVDFAALINPALSSVYPLRGNLSRAFPRAYPAICGAIPRGGIAYTSYCRASSLWRGVVMNGDVVRNPMW